MLTGFNCSRVVTVFPKGTLTVFYLALKNLVLRARSELIGYAELYSN